MARDTSVYLLDILDACAAIDDVMDGVSLDDYRARRSVRSAVEREFILIGEALRRISGVQAAIFESITNARSIIDFRNLLAHDYGAVDDDAVYGLVYSDLVVLKAEVSEILATRVDAN
jgi:uncharacterized protein with HEPN domain